MDNAQHTPVVTQDQVNKALDIFGGGLVKRDGTVFYYPKIAMRAVLEATTADLQARLDASEARVAEFENRFWSIVDPNSVPSDMWDALERLASAYRLATARSAEGQSDGGGV